jgi:hypothetical protein
MHNVFDVIAYEDVFGRKPFWDWHERLDSVAQEKASTAVKRMTQNIALTSVPVIGFIAGGMEND